MLIHTSMLTVAHNTQKHIVNLHVEALQRAVVGGDQMR